MKKILVLLTAMVVGCTSMFAESKNLKTNFDERFVLIEEAEGESLANMYYDKYSGDTVFASQKTTIEDETHWMSIYYSDDEDDYWEADYFDGDMIKTSDKGSYVRLFFENGYTYIMWIDTYDGIEYQFKCYKVGERYLTLVYRHIKED